MEFPLGKAVGRRFWWCWKKWSSYGGDNLTWKLRLTLTLITKALSGIA